MWGKILVSSYPYNWTAHFYFCEYTLIGYSCANEVLYFVGMLFKDWHVSKMNNPVALRSRPLETLTQLSLCLPGYLFENDSRVVPEKFEGEPAASITLHSLIVSFFFLKRPWVSWKALYKSKLLLLLLLLFARCSPLCEMLVWWFQLRNSIYLTIISYRRQGSLCKS